MHNKNNNKSQNFIQGLRPFSSSIPKNLKKYLKKGGYNYSNIVDNWTKMVSKKISDACYPISVKMGKEMKDGTLVLNVLHGKELEIEYEKNEIMDKLNSFFGYNCISQINLKIVQEKIQFKKNRFPKLKNILKINERISQVEDNQLKSSLNNFLKAFNERNK
ncbi:MAG: DciA family protein [Candidatus Pelagibacter sp.]